MIPSKNSGIPKHAKFKSIQILDLPEPFVAPLCSAEAKFDKSVNCQNVQDLRAEIAKHLGDAQEWSVYVATNEKDLPFFRDDSKRKSIKKLRYNA